MSSLLPKIFGNELMFTMLDGDKQVRTALANFNPWERIKEFLSMQEILYEKAGMFLDSSYVVPMGSGLPIRLNLAGSAACYFKISKMLNNARLSEEFQLTANIASRFVLFLYVYECVFNIFKNYFIINSKKFIYDTNINIIL